MDYSRYDDARYGEREVNNNGLLEVVQCPTTAAALTNCVYLAPGVVDPQIHYIMVDRQFVFTIRYGFTWKHERADNLNFSFL